MSIGSYGYCHNRSHWVEFDTTFSTNALYRVGPINKYLNFVAPHTAIALMKVALLEHLWLHRSDFTDHLNIRR